MQAGPPTPPASSPAAARRCCVPARLPGCHAAFRTCCLPSPPPCPPSPPAFPATFLRHFCSVTIGVRTPGVSGTTCTAETSHAWASTQRRPRLMRSPPRLASALAGRRWKRTMLGGASVMPAKWRRGSRRRRRVWACAAPRQLASPRPRRRPRQPRCPTAAARCPAAAATPTGAAAGRAWALQSAPPKAWTLTC